ncbi:hypothetical protein R2Q81_06115 [Microbacterium aquimaris]|uniref:hypothetical protein n=1 Tax=Microbacterium aquimaris TaxID=459816 RepID=UPI002AD2614C|nr:hypothetical protein [Microbacterium aquimaris]MDZ8275526.1 hypothetical protein [Microbacterium aquimaris]
MSRRVLFAGVGLLTVAAVIAAAWWLLAARGEPTARETAEDYLAALERGDVAQIEALRRDPLPEGAAEAFSGARSVTDARVEAIDTSRAGRATVEASAAFGDTRRQIPFTVLSQGDGAHVVIDDLGELTASTSPGDAVQVGGTSISDGASLPLLPARYPLAPLPAEVLTGADEVAISSQEIVEVMLDAALADDAVATVQSAIEAYADDCTARADAVPAACGFDVPWPADFDSVETITYRVDVYPTVQEFSLGDAVYASDGVVVATVRGDPRGGGDGEQTYRTEDWSLRGTLSFEDTRAVISVF